MVEINEISEREYLIAENVVYLGGDNMIYITVVGEIDNCQKNNRSMR